MIAVSTTEDPTDPWHAYWWDAIGQSTSGTTGLFADYSALGIDRFGIYQTNAVADDNHHTPNHSHVAIFPADDLAAGPAPIQGSQYSDLQEPDGRLADGIRPVTHHGTTPRTYFVSRNPRRDRPTPDLGTHEPPHQ